MHFRAPARPPRETERIADRVRRTQSGLELAIVSDVASFNNERLHEPLGDLPPAKFEALHEFRYAATTHVEAPRQRRIALLSTGVGSGWTAIV
jgi:hypothetical protein